MHSCSSWRVSFFVGSLQIICQSLRDIAIERTAANSNPKAVAAAVAAAKGASAPLPELAAAVSKVATSIDNVYFLSSLGNPALDPFRFCDKILFLLQKSCSLGLVIFVFAVTKVLEVLINM